jgi:hypothetical protein
MPVFEQDLNVDLGGDFAFTTVPYVIVGVIQDFTHYTCRLNVYSSGCVCESWHGSDGHVYLQLTSAPGAFGGVVQNGTAGTVTGTITKAATSTLPSTNGPLRYDVWIDSPASPPVSTLLQQGRIFPDGAWGSK